MRTLSKLCKWLVILPLAILVFQPVSAEEDMSLFAYVMNTYNKSEFDLSQTEKQLDKLVSQYTKANLNNQMVESFESIKRYAEYVDQEINVKIDHEVETLRDSMNQDIFNIEQGLLELDPHELSSKLLVIEKQSDQVDTLLADKTSMVALLGNNTIEVIDTTELEMTIEEKKSILDYSVDNGNTDFGDLSKLRRPFNAPVYLTSEAGYRIDPIANYVRYHEAVDYGMPIGTELYSLFNGTVVISDYTQDGYGNNVKIDCGSGITIHYAHMNERVVKVGDTVKQNQLIGYSGNTGYSTGPHLHMGIFYKGEILSVERLFDNR